MALGTRSGGPQEFAVFRRDRHIIDARFPAPHKTIAVEFPLFVAMRAGPLAGGIPPFILEAHGDTVLMKCPKLLDQPVIEFVRPFPGEEFHDRRAPTEKLRAVPPPAVL